MPAKKVLVIDDERVIHAFLKAVFEKAGFKITSALDAMQGPMVARQVSPDLIVLDISMPGGGGYQVFERLRKLVGTMDTPVLIYTALPKEEVLKQIPEGPDVAFVGKPSSPEEILATANKLLGAEQPG